MTPPELDPLHEIVYRHCSAAETEARAAGFGEAQIAACIFSHGLGNALDAGVPVDSIKASVDSLAADRAAETAVNVARGGQS